MLTLWPILLALGFAAAAIVIFVFGICPTVVYENKHGEFGFHFDDVEHDSAGVPRTGWKLRVSQIWEGIWSRPCYFCNKLLGRLK